MASGKAYVYIPTDSLVYIVIDDKAVFEALPYDAEHYFNSDNPALDVDVKVTQEGQGQLIFQYFPNQNGGK